MDSSQINAKRTFWCFISYRHADNKELGRQWATWLHQAIETYEVPADLVGKPNDRGEIIPERIFPVFRDEEELPVDSELASPIYRALDNSKYLLVICSPRAVESSYVASEIRYFKQLGHEDRVLAAMIDGEPNASWDAGKQAHGADPSRECFPEPLRHRVDAEGRVLADRTEPIAADFRLDDGTQGWASPEAYRQALSASGMSSAQKSEAVESYRKKCDLMKLKIISGILGVSLGTLTKRDAAYQLALAQKRSRSLRRWLAAVGLLAILALAGGGVASKEWRVATANAAEADTARKQAESNLTLAQKEQHLADEQKIYAQQQEKVAKDQTAVAEEQRKIADTQKAEAVKETAEVVKQKARVLHDLSQYDFEKAGSLVTKLREKDAIACLCRAIREDPKNGAALTLFYNLIIRQVHWPLPLALPLILPQPVEYLQFSPDGTQFLTISRDPQSTTCTLQNWNAETFAPIGQPITEGVPIGTRATYGTDGNEIVAYSDTLLPRLWDSRTGQRIGSPLGPSENNVELGKADDLFFGENDNHQMLLFILGQLGPDTAFSVWNGKTGEIMQSPDKKNAAMALGIKFCASAVLNMRSMRAALKVETNHVVLWDLRKNRQAGRDVHVNGTLFDYGLSPDGSKLFTGAMANDSGSWKGIVQIWDASTGEPTGQPMPSNDFKAATFSPDGQSLFITETSNGQLREVATGQPMADTFISVPNLFNSKESNSIPLVQFEKSSFSPGGTEVLGIGAGGLVLWDTNSSTLLADPIPNYCTGIVSAVFNLDGSKILTAAGRVVQLYEMAPPKNSMAPDWLSDFGEAVADGQFTDSGKFTTLTPEEIATTRQRLQQISGDDIWSKLSRWYFTDPAKRTISPDSTVMMADYVRRLIEIGTTDSLDDADALAAGQPDMLAQIATKRAVLPPTPAPRK